MFKKWLVRTSPFVILSLFAAAVLLYELVLEPGVPEGLRYPLLLKLLFFIIIIVITDFILKHLISRNYLLWIIEILMSLSLLYYWIVT